VVALLLTTMHMTLLGALIALAPRALYDTHGFALQGLALTPLEDQQMAGVVMLALGGVSYLAGGVWLLARLLRGSATAQVRRWT
jgi:putative membrane protein